MFPEIRKLDAHGALSQNLLKNYSEFLHSHLGEFRDPLTDIEEALIYARDQGGFVYTLMGEGEKLLGLSVVLDTKMKRFVPPYFLVYIAVDSSLRGQGFGGKLIEFIQEDLKGGLSLHVEHDNPAKRLYERLGFTSKYAEMRWSHTSWLV